MIEANALHDQRVSKFLFSANLIFQNAEIARCVRKNFRIEINALPFQS